MSTATAALAATISHQRLKCALTKFQSNPNIHMTSSSIDKLDRLMTDGHEKLHIIADFDMTITQNYIYNSNKQEWERNCSAHGMFMRWSKANDEFKRKTQAICDKYYPIEIDQSISEQEKIPHMVDWWQQSHDLILSLNLTRADLTDMVKEIPVVFRSGSRQLFELCERIKVPVLLFSAGIGNVIQEILKQHQFFPPTSSLFHVLSNQMIFDQQKLVGFQDPLLHVFNKNESILYEQESFKNYAKQISNRGNVILIGDSLGDIRMGQGMKHNCELSIGLLNSFSCTGDSSTFESKVKQTQQQCKQLLEKYKEVYDIVVTGDIGFDESLNVIISCCSADSCSE